jgi:hypothetical protein
MGGSVTAVSLPALHGLMDDHDIFKTIDYFTEKSLPATVMSRIACHNHHPLLIA